VKNRHIISIAKIKLTIAFCKMHVMQNSSEFCFLLFFIHIVIRRFTLIPNITFSVLKTRFFMDKISKYWKELEKSKGGGRIRPFLRPMLELIYSYRVWIRDCSWSLFSTLFRENGHSIFSCLGSPPGIMKKNISSSTS
jgi:hypothetical protein